MTFCFDIFLNFISFEDPTVDSFRVEQVLRSEETFNLLAMLSGAMIRELVKNRKIYEIHWSSMVRHCNAPMQLSLESE